MNAVIGVLVVMPLTLYIIVTIGAFFGNAIFWYEARASQYPLGEREAARGAVMAPFWPVAAARFLVRFIRALPEMFKDARP